MIDGTEVTDLGMVRVSGGGGGGGTGGGGGETDAPYQQMQ